jgi:CRISPR-associated endoribonuclease Cas6
VTRFIISFTSSEEEIDKDAFNKHYLQSVIYSRFNQEGEKGFHESNNFRFFSFSDFFPSGNMRRGETRKVIISSPDDKIIGLLAKSFAQDGQMFLGPHKFEVISSKTLRFGFPFRAYISGSPVVLYKDNRNSKFFSLKDGDGISFFMERIKENAIKKYTQFSGKTVKFLDGPIFDNIRLKKEVSVKINHREGDFFIIGSLWEKLGIGNGKKIDYDFYKFIMECGLGEKNSLGFGFLNPIKEVDNAVG